MLSHLNVKELQLAVLAHRLLRPRQACGPVHHRMTSATNAAGDGGGGTTPRTVVTGIAAPGIPIATTREVSN
jgi:hypothetical protein